MRGTTGNDLLNGTPGDDWIEGLAGNDQIFGWAGRDILRGGAGDDRISGGADGDGLRGGGGNDILRGGADGDALEGEAGRDQLYGEAGPDSLNGGDGPDLIEAGAGADTVWVSRGSDVATLGPDADLIAAGLVAIGNTRISIGSTTVTDFKPGTDKLELLMSGKDNEILDAPDWLDTNNDRVIDARDKEVSVRQGALVIDLDAVMERAFGVKPVATEALTLQHVPTLSLSDFQHPDPDAGILIPDPG